MRDYQRACALLKCNKIYFSKEDNCLLINESGIHNAVRLKPNQEEADTKVILYCLDALNDLEAYIPVQETLI